MTSATLQRFKQSLVFNVTNEETRDSLTGLPCIKQIQPGRHNAFAWNLPALGPEFDFAIGWEMGLAYLRANAWATGTDTKDSFDGGGAGNLYFIADALRLGNAPEGQWQGFFDCLEAFNDYALNAPPQVFSGIVARLIALDDATLRARCLSILDGVNPPDIFSPEGLDW